MILVFCTQDTYLPALSSVPDTTLKALTIQKCVSNSPILQAAERLFGGYKLINLWALKEGRILFPVPGMEGETSG